MNGWPVIRGIISDLDGVTYRGDDPIESAVEAFQAWHEAQLPFAFVTDNSTRSAQEFSDKLNGMFIPAIPERVITSSSAAADRLTESLPPAPASWLWDQQFLPMRWHRTVSNWP